jgi:hypothetical protein
MYILCRHCHNLVYESQRKDHATRLVSKAQNIRRRLGGGASLMEAFPPKPQGMCWRTYSLLYLKARCVEETGTRAMMALLAYMAVRSHMSIIKPGDG